MGYHSVIVIAIKIATGRQLALPTVKYDLLAISFIFRCELLMLRSPEG